METNRNVEEFYAHLSCRNAACIERHCRKIHGEAVIHSVAIVFDGVKQALKLLAGKRDGHGVETGRQTI